jgi:hypothetical protein
MNLAFDAEDGRHTLEIEDDGRVAYAYLKDWDRIVGDVWLFNRCDAPDAEEWRDKSKLPFANCRGYFDEAAGRIQEPLEPDDFQVDWDVSEEAARAYIYLREDLIAVVATGTKPGVSRFATKNGPLAKVMEFE